MFPRFLRAICIALISSLQLKEDFKNPFSQLGLQVFGIINVGMTLLMVSC